jgi:hypothetical protein
VWFLPGDGESTITAEPVAQYLDALAGQSGSTVGVHLTATKRLAQAAALTGLLPAWAVAAVTGVKAPRGATSGVGNWLTQSQARKLLGEQVRPSARRNDPIALGRLRPLAGFRSLTSNPDIHAQSSEGRVMKIRYFATVKVAFLPICKLITGDSE